MRETDKLLSDLVCKLLYDIRMREFPDELIASQRKRLQKFIKKLYNF